MTQWPADGQLDIPTLAAAGASILGQRLLKFAAANLG